VNLKEPNFLNYIGVFKKISSRLNDSFESSFDWDCCTLCPWLFVNQGGGMGGKLFRRWRTWKSDRLLLSTQRSLTQTRTQSPCVWWELCVYVFVFAAKVDSRLRIRSLSLSHIDWRSLDFVHWLSHSLALSLSLPTSLGKTKQRALTQAVRLVLQRNSAFFDVCSCCTHARTHSQTDRQTKTKERQPPSNKQQATAKRNQADTNFNSLLYIIFFVVLLYKKWN